MKLVKSSKEWFTTNEGQLGGQAGHDISTLTLIEDLEKLICHCSHKSLINFDNDGAACYDRIVSNIANLIGGKKGFHRNLTFVHALTLSEANSSSKWHLGLVMTSINIAKPFQFMTQGRGA
eukprot:8263418-Ditylum_brightwellii.AAC.1